MSDLERRRQRSPAHYATRGRPLIGLERVVPRKARRSEMPPWRLALLIIGPMLLVGLGGIAAWLGYLSGGG